MPPPPRPPPPSRLLRALRVRLHPLRPSKPQLSSSEPTSAAVATNASRSADLGLASESEVGFSDLSVDGFNNPEYTAAYKESMAAEAQVTSSNVEIISVVNPQEGMVRRRRLLRRLLQSNTLATAPASAPSEAFPDGETGVSEEVTGALGPAPSPSQNAVTCVVESEILILKQSPVLETFIATLETNVTAIFQNESIFQNITETSKVTGTIEIIEGAPWPPPPIPPEPLTSSPPPPLPSPSSAIEASDGNDGNDSVLESDWFLPVACGGGGLFLIGALGYGKRVFDRRNKVVQSVNDEDRDVDGGASFFTAQQDVQEGQSPHEDAPEVNTNSPGIDESGSLESLQSVQDLPQVRGGSQNSPTPSSPPAETEETST
ncbi:hypothetical protein CYMTET_35422 [Cymbomonas tetramitiformis]|uniref:Uncharacterized protein n=1 Tax=Cymbomonas tetramitiformis TaxID=36881 RepID=A0AAE0KNW5_9CHLO|nr:hypothetical protein CYMTET_35422 [Cymbomonas tetramitiformis]